ncbi:M14 family zinc carboxypeptidase [Oryzobacter sp. R7]|uniref:M14 family zinc carboxypeptidase n=1 Tax=Oryzobacter faecalis TaxID=3388656 RepID=UPI00398CB854
MGRILLPTTLFTSLATAAVLALPAQPSLARPPDTEHLDAYTARVTSAQVADLVRAGYDVGGRKVVGDTLEVSLVLTPGESRKLARQGVDISLTRVKGGRTVREMAAAQAAGGYTVWRSYDEPGGIRDQMVAAAAANPSVAKLVTLGTTHQGRDILAVKLTQGANGIADGARPAVLFSATQHAREWISTEVDRRLMRWYLDRWRANDPAVKSLLQTTELWFVLVANPDGYQYTFDHERLWRKNLRDNDGNGVVSFGDGVDPNRNFPNHWGYDEEGSSSLPSSETYRGPAPVSEPETKALKWLLDRVRFEFQVNYHSNGQWLLYAEGWQVATPTADDPIYSAMSGNLDNPAIEGFHPGLSSDVLYVTNGETTDYAHATTGALAWTPELSEGCDGCGFVFPDDEALVQEEFLRNLPFAQSVARSAVDPANPKTVTGLTTKPFYLDSDDPYKRGLPGTQLSFGLSYGDPQPVAVIAKRSLGAVSAKYRVNGGPVRSTTTTEWAGGETTRPAAVHYHQVRGVVTGTRAGDSVEVWFEGGGQRSPSFTYRVVSDTGGRVLVVAAEDYTGASPVQTPGPHYARYHLDALRANGITADLYDIDARGRVAPDALGVLSHYDTVVWYGGDDVITRRAGWGPGNADRLALDELLEFRAYLDEGGTVVYTGDFAGEQYTGNVGTQLYDPKGEIACNPLPAGVDPRRCLVLAGSGDGTNDVLQ